MLQGLSIVSVLLDSFFGFLNHVIQHFVDLRLVKNGFQERMHLVICQQCRLQEKGFQHTAAGENAVIAGLSLKLRFLMLKCFEPVLVIGQLHFVAFPFCQQLLFFF